jgi:glycosyltransferase involved in cell wall biosynthesis
MSGATVAVVAIGRNEGQRLGLCLKSAVAAGPATVVYVDSGSTDGSVALARNLGCEVVCLDLTIPFTAARARNEGFAKALQTEPALDFVQFVDGDCEIVQGWIQSAAFFLDTHPEVAVACGRRRERFPQNSLYNQLCDIEWNTPVGQTKSCGGDALMRAKAVQAVGGYRASLIAGEEPELCVRLRAAGWQVWRLDHEMTLHDAAMLRFGQWWRRTKRAGHAFAEGASLHGKPPERHWVRELRSAVFWGGLLPLIIFSLAAAVSSWCLALLLVYLWQALRLYLRSKAKVPMAGTYAALLVMGKFAEAAGALQYLANKTFRKQATLIEYK